MKLSKKFLSSALIFALSGLPAGMAHAAPAPAAKGKQKGKTPPSPVPGSPVPDKKDDKKKTADKKDDERSGPASFNATNARPGQQSAEEEKREQLADKKRDEQIEQLKTVIKEVPAGSGQKAELIFQLAELYYEKSKYLYAKEMRGYFKAQDDIAARRDKGEKVEDAKLDNSQSRLWRDEALRLYSQILKDYPTYERKDEVLFTLAYNQYEDQKTRNQAIQNYWALIKQYPNSKFLYDAYVQLGEHFFNSNDLEKARKAYLEAFKSTNMRVHTFAQYKLAWCDFNAGDYDGSIKRFKDVVALSEKSRTTGATAEDKANGKILKGEALNDIIMPFVQIEATDEAVKYFEESTGKKQAHKLTQKLAARLAEGGKHDGAIHVYRGLIAADPYAEEAPGYQNAIVKSYEQERKRDLVQKEMFVLVRTFGPKSEWWKRNEKNKKALESAFEDTEGAMRSMVTEYHREAQTTKDVATYKLAANIYKEYLDNFESSEYAFNLRFYYAEILYTLMQWEPAAEQYEKVSVSQPGEYGNKDYIKTAAYDALLCYEKLVAISKGELKQVELKDNEKVTEGAGKAQVTKRKIALAPDKKDQKEEEVPKWEKKLADACDRYVQLVPNDKSEIDLRYKAAFIYYDHFHFIEAASRFGDIINKWPQHEFSRKAADFTLNILETKEQWSELNRLSRAFFANKKLTGADKDFTTRLAGIVEGSQYKVNENLYEDAKKANDQDKKFVAATAFRDFVKEFKSSKYAPRALVYSMIVYQDANHLDQAVDVGEQLLKEYPDTEFTPRTWLYLGSFYDKTAQYAKSANAYEQFVKMWEKAHGIVDKNAKPGAKGAVAAAPKKAPPPPAAKKGPAKPGDRAEADKPVDITAELDKGVADALFNAALWHEGLGEDDKAIATYQKYIDYVDQKKPGFDKKTDAPEVFFNIGLIHEKAGRKKEAALVFEQYQTRFAKQITPSKSYYAKYKQFVLVRDLHPPTSVGNKHVEDKEVAKLMTELITGYAKLDQAGKDDDGNLNAFGHVRFLALEPKWKEFVSINFKDPKHLVQDLKEKLKRMDDIQKSYTDVLATRSGEWGIAALTRIGLGYEDFARDLIDSPDPKGLSPDQLEMYRGEIENKAFPLEDKAVEALEKALDKSSELKLYSEWTLKAQDQLNKVRPGAFGDLRSVSYRGSEFFATAQPALAEVAVPKPPPEPTPAPGPAADPNAPKKQPEAAPKAGSGGN